MALFTCYDILNPIIQPAMRIVQAISQSNPCMVTTVNPHLYVDNMIVRMDIPNHFGMPEINGLTGTILVTGNNTFTITIDSTGFSPFSYPVVNNHNPGCPQVVPIGEQSSTLRAAVQNVLPGKRLP